VKVSRLGLRVSALGGIVVAGMALALTGQGAAQADTAAQAGTTSGNGSVGSGNQLVLPVSVPIDLCGNVVAALGLGRAECTGGAAVAGGAGSGGTAGGSADSPGLGKVEQAAPTAQNAGASGTSGTGGLLSGNEISVPVTVPVTVCGNAAAVLGEATASCQSPRPSTPRKSPVPPQPRHVMQSAPTRHPKVIHPETASVAGILPITGVNLAGMTAGAAVFLTVGAGTLLGARRRS
jgi:hypothetical protein